MRNRQDGSSFSRSFTLTLPAPCTSEICIKIKIHYKRHYKKLDYFLSSSGIGTGKINKNLLKFLILFFHSKDLLHYEKLSILDLPHPSKLRERKHVAKKSTRKKYSIVESYLQQLRRKQTEFHW